LTKRRRVDTFEEVTETEVFMDITSTKILNNGVKIPVLGLGVFRVENDRVCTDAVRWALEAGYRHIDTAAIYGNEEATGKGIKESGVPREEIFLTTKLWNEDMRMNRQEAAFEESLKRLETDYVDLYLIHWPVPGKFAESWKVLEKLFRDGRIRAAGVSNFHAHHLEEIAKISDLVPAVNQIECHPLLSQKALVDYCGKKDIAVTAWSPLGGVKLNLAENETLKKISAKFGKTPVQVVLRWDLQRGIITIPKSVRKERIIENRNIFDFELSADDMRIIDSMNKDQRAGSDPDNFNF
jgi:diketogulonate reductase-like aldo/keto reductase